MKVISSGILVTNPNIIPIIASGILNALFKTSNVLPSKFPNYK